MIAIKLAAEISKHLVASLFCSGGRRKISVPVYTEDESNDLSDLGIGTSSASGKSSMSEDFDNHSVIVSILEGANMIAGGLKKRRKTMVIDSDDTICKFANLLFNM